MDKFWERYIQSRPAPGESKGAFEAFAAANRDPEPRNMAHGGRIGFLKGKRVKDKIFKYPYSNQHGTFYSDKPVDMDRTQNREYKIDKPTKKQLEIAEKVHGKKYNKTGIDLWESLEQFERSNIRERRTTGQTSGIGKPKKNMLSKTDFIELVKNNRNKTYNEFVEIIKKYKTKDGKTFTKSIVADRLRAYNLSGSFKKEPPKGTDNIKKAEAEKKRQEFLKETEPTKAKGTKKYPFHHIRQIAGGIPLTTDDVVIINQRMNSVMSQYNQALNRISAAIQKNNKLALEAMNAKNEGAALDYMKRVDELNAQAEKIVNSAIDKLPKKYKGLVGFNQFELPRNEYGLPISNEPMIVKKVGGVPISKDAIDLTTLDLNQEKEFKKIVRQQAEAGKTGPINKKEINRIFKNVGINLPDDLKVKAQNFLRSALNKGQDISKFLPFKTLRKPGMAGVAALDYGLFHYLFDVPSATAALGASGWLTKSRPISDTILAQTQTMSFIDEMNQKKEEDERIENALAAHRLKKSRETARDIKPFELDFSLPQEFAGGGMAGIRRPSAIPPESGPQSQGLASLKKYGSYY